MKTTSVSTHFSSRARYAEKSSKIKEDIVRSFPALSLDCGAQDISDLLKIMEDIQLAVNAGDGENVQIIGALQNRLDSNQALPQDFNKAELMRSLIVAATHKPGVLSHFSLIKKEKFNYFSSTNYTNTMSRLKQKISSQYQINVDGSFYVGQMEKNITSNTWLAHGRGSQTYPSGIKYTGDFKFGIPNGKGIFTYPNGSEYSTYTGDVKSGIPHGKGTLQYTDGSTYTGDVKSGMKHGKGIFEQNPNDPNSYRYEGAWQNGEFHGKGTITYQSGYRYEGDFYSGKRYGQGSETYPDGTKFKGYYLNDKKTDGTMTFPDGNKYVGSFVDEKFEGKGTYYDMNSVPPRTEHGIWNQGKCIRRIDPPSPLKLGPYTKSSNLPLTATRIAPYVGGHSSNPPETTQTAPHVISTSGPYDFPETTPNLYQMNKDASDAAMMSFFIQEVIQSDW